MKKDTPSYVNFNAEKYKWKPDIDYSKHPELYRVGKGEQGVLICEPYKSEIGPYWRFKNEEVALESSEKIFALFLDYVKENDFVGADLARKYLQMGFTRSRRYFNYKGGKKYDALNNYELLERGSGDPEKAKSANVFYKKWQAAEELPEYKKMKSGWKEKYG
ncbi:DUF4385 domain-containing protein [Chryseobacterium hagamense]|uniref:DUF4385 domain-containing protein n=1 Tax=Chryseobacterium hagamense TaxID=395935 RepID=A0A511YQX9_9FLAO|nr:DUF4385 domain-containing protein [Chryseobacterium hagamense]GEN77592.1 hypothetical protein CHA01nite_33320 [Chryseobacterium hagamense]